MAGMYAITIGRFRKKQNAVTEYKINFLFKQFLIEDSGIPSFLVPLVPYSDNSGRIESRHKPDDIFNKSS